ncbi:hypothetical protein ILUMI_06947 [Ignelater luminosus]|uniref:Uncharacterized protein n=1 Tax=Ignelater luminosus TaxID=2038154 RepID=A0A8K0D987_IGNLU|nr:hypothetical protein ILUMI_06947 [Ignelater luminosus]
MINSSAFFCCIIILISINISNCLECYVCDNQEDNAEKCLNTIVTCEQEEDVCLSEISWGSTPYWTFGAAKQYYVSKRCSTKERCARYRSSIMPLCTHIWYQDWKCSECCKGDRCNYYIISAANHSSSGIGMMLSSLAVLIFTKWNIFEA